MHPDELDRLGRSLGFHVHAEVVQAKKASKKDPGLLVARYHDGGRRRCHCAAQGLCFRCEPGSHLPEWTVPTTWVYF